MNLKNRNLLIPALILPLILVAASFDVGLTIIKLDVTYDSEAEQMNSTVIVEGSNITMMIPISYHMQQSKNVSPEKPGGWYDASGWTVYEDGSPIIPTENQSHLFWYANLSANNTFMEFHAEPPSLTIVSENTTKAVYEKNFTVTSQNHFTNVSLTMNASLNHTLYTLFWFNGTSFVDRTLSYNLQSSAGAISFGNFNTSDQYFSLLGYCEEDWSCSSWSGDNCGTRTCNDQNNCGTTASKPEVSRECADEGSSGGGGGGSIGGTPSPFPGTDEEEIPDIDIIPNPIYIEIQHGEKEEYLISVLNKDKEDISMELELIPEPDYMKLSEEELVLSSGQEGKLKLKLDIPETFPLGEKESKLRFKFDRETFLLVNITVNITEKQKSISLEMPERTFVSGDKIEFLYEIADFSDSDQKTAEIMFYLKNNSVLSKILGREPIVLSDNKQMSIDKSLSFEAEQGAYDLCVDLYMDGAVYTDCQPIEILESLKEKPSLIKKDTSKKSFALLIILVALAGFLAGLYAYHKKHYLLSIPSWITTRQQLRDYLKSLPDRKMKRYKSGKNDDVSEFIRHVLGDDTLANRVHKAGSTSLILELLKEDPLTAAKKKNNDSPKNKPAEKTTAKKDEKEKYLKEEKDESKPQPEPDSDKKRNTEKVAEAAYDFSKLPKSKDEYFVLNNGVELKSISDLLSYLHVMPEEIFLHHVRAEKNDFANWIEHIFGLKDLADKLRTVHSKDNMIRILDDSKQKT